MRRAAVLVALAALAVAASPHGAGAARTTPIDGRWRWNWTYDELLRCCGKPTADAQAGPSLSEFRGGRIYALDAATGRLIGLRGTYSVAGDVVTFVFSHHYPGHGLVPGRAYVMRFSLFRDRLTWSHVPGRAGIGALAVAPWTRVG
jgi:hypothetical protein